MTNVDKLSILTHKNLKLTKVWGTDGSVKPSDMGKHFQLKMHEITDLHSLSDFLTELEFNHSKCIIRGKYVGDEENEEVRRTKDNFTDQPLHTIMFDIDDFEPQSENPLDEPEKCIAEYIESKLPKVFHNKSYHFQLSSSAGKEGKAHLLKAHVWMWLKQPYTSQQLRSWAENQSIEVDKALFDPIQIHYTANPIFEDGIVDPVKRRSGFASGNSGDNVDLVIDDESLNGLDTHQTTRSAKMTQAIENDSIASQLAKSEYFKSLKRDDGGIFIKCPFSDGHSVESGESSTIYYPANTAGYKTGMFKCMHQSCTSRTRQDFIKQLDYDDERVLNAQDPTDIARRFIADRYTADGIVTLLYSQGTWYKYIGTHYKTDVDSDRAMRADIRSYLEKSLKKIKQSDVYTNAKFAPKTADISNIEEALKDLTLSEGLEAPKWLQSLSKEKAYNHVSLKNGILDISTRKLLPHSPKFFCLYSLPFEYAEAGEPTEWIRFLKSIFNDDEESISAIQEWFGYFLTSATMLQKGLMMIGPPRSGKGTLIRILNELVGADNVSGGALKTLQSNFGLQPLKDKLVANFPDVRFGNGDIHTITSYLLSIIGEDKITVDRKHKTPWYGTITARVVITSNNLPRFPDSSNAIFSRFIYIETKNSFLNKEDIGLDERLKSELSQILSWALDGQQRLFKKKRFTQPEASKHLYNSIRILGNPIQAFVEEMCELDSDFKIPKSYLYARYRSWSEDGGFKGIKEKNSFAQALYDSFPNVCSKKGSLDGERIQFFKGIRIKPEIDNDDLDEIENATIHETDLLDGL